MTLLIWVSERVCVSAVGWRTADSNAARLKPFCRDRDHNCAMSGRNNPAEKSFQWQIWPQNKLKAYISTNISHYLMLTICNKYWPVPVKVSFVACCQLPTEGKGQHLKDSWYIAVSHTTLAVWAVSLLTTPSSVQRNLDGVAECKMQASIQFLHLSTNYIMGK